MTMTERAVSTVAGYVTILAVMTLLTTGLLVAGGDFVGDQREVTVREELKVVGERLSGDITAVERLGTAGTDGTGHVRLHRSFPADAAGSSYTVSFLDGGSGPRLVIATNRPEVTVTVRVALTEDSAAHAGTVVEENTVQGGDIVVVYDTAPDPNEVTIRHA